GGGGGGGEVGVRGAEGSGQRRERRKLDERQVEHRRLGKRRQRGQRHCRRLGLRQHGTGGEELRQRGGWLGKLGRRRDLIGVRPRSPPPLRDPGLEVPPRGGDGVEICPQDAELLVELARGAGGVVVGGGLELARQPRLRRGRRLHALALRLLKGGGELAPRGADLGAQSIDL